MYLRRKVDAFLEEWKADKNRKPLIVKGSRQIGKMESILHFAADHYENVIEINFVRNEKYKGIFTLIPSYKNSSSYSQQKILLTMRSIFLCFRFCKKFIQIVVPFWGANYI